MSERYRWLICFCCSVLVALAWPGGSAVAERRVALVIGNAGYTAVSALKNPRKDADLMAATLERVGFTVIKLVDVDQKNMKRALRDFGRALRASNAIGLFYYAGHGVQVRGQNYLIPVNANIRDESEIELEGVNVNAFLQTMERASSSINIVILDACRNNPYASTFRSAHRGLARVDAPRGTYIGYATSPGQVAEDGTAGHSPYTKALSDAITRPGLTIEEVFKRARRTVLAATGNQQTPWETSSITGNFYFAGASPQSAPPVARPDAPPRGQVKEREVPAAAKEAYAAAKEIGTIAAWEAFLGRFPTGFYADLARAARAKKRTALSPPAPAPSPGPVEPPVTRSGRSTWNHNGSVMYLEADGAQRRFYYQTPRPGMQKAGARRGSLLFQGRRVGDRYEGTAYLFSRRCGKISYRVSGRVENEGRVVMYGQAPRRNRSTCRVIGYKPDTLVFDHMR